MLNRSAIHVASEDRFDTGTAERAGSLRLAAASAMWGGLFEVEPGARTGEQHTIAFVLSGRCEIRSGEQGEFRATARAGDFIHVPAFVPHRESR
jgi:uncharacterized RmlC-like cupin family protein